MTQPFRTVSDQLREFDEFCKGSAASPDFLADIRKRIADGTVYFSDGKISWHFDSGGLLPYFEP